MFLVDSCVSREGCSSLVETDSGLSEDVFVVDVSLASVDASLVSAVTSSVLVAEYFVV